MSFIERNCSTCSGNPKYNRVVKAPNPSELLSFSDLKNQWNGFFAKSIKSKSFFSYDVCTTCGLAYCPIFFSQEQLNNLYSNMPDNTANLDVNMLSKTQKGYYQLYRPYIPEINGDYLEFGPDIGLFTKNMLVQGFGNFVLVEPNKSVWPQLEKLINGFSYQLCEGIFTENKIADSSLKSVVMIHVLDHLLNPRDVLMQIKSKMKIGATLCIVTHDFGSLLARTLGFRWPAFCLQHPQLYSAISIRKLLDEVGFKTLAVKKTYNHFPIEYLINHLLWSLGIKNIDARKLGKFHIPLKLGNILTIASV